MSDARGAAAARWEEDAARYLRDGGLAGAERQRVKHPDRGDIGGVPDWTIECKGLDKMARRKVDAAWADWSHVEPAVHLASANNAQTMRDAFEAGYEAGRLAVPRFDMARAMDQAMKARAVNGHPYAAVIRKRSGMPAGRAYFITELGLAVSIMRQLEEL